METDGHDVTRLVRTTYEQAAAAPWDVTPEQIRSAGRHRRVPSPDPKVLALVAAAAALLAFGIFYLRPATSRTSAPPPPTTTTVPQGRTAVPNIVGLSQAQAAMVLGGAGLDVGSITTEPSTTFPAGTVIGSDPTAATSLATGATVDVTVSSGPGGAGGSVGTTVPSTAAGAQALPGGTAGTGTAAAASDCPSGNRAITVGAAEAQTCVRSGARLTVTFVSLRWWSGYGTWSSAAPAISDGSVLDARSYTASATTASAAFIAHSPGTTTVTAQFDVACAPEDTSPCTVPPQASETLHVTVVPG